MILLPKKYKIRVNMYINEEVCFGTSGQLNGKQVIIDKIRYNPSGEEVVDFILSRTGLAGKFNANSWKREFIIDVNATEKKGYDSNMNLNDFLEVLISEKVVSVIEIKDETKPIVIETPKLDTTKKQMTLI